MPFVKGYKMSEEMKKKISDGCKRSGVGKSFSWQPKGYTHSQEARKKMSDSHKGKTGARLGMTNSPEHRAKIRAKLLGIKNPERSLEYRANISKQNLKRVAEGTHHLYKDGRTPLIKKLRGCLEYVLWRTAVFQRDNYTCQDCGIQSGCGRTTVFNADHINPLSTIITNNQIKTFEQAISCKELWDIKNGQTLCVACHMKTPTFGFRLSNLMIYKPDMITA